MIQIYFCMVNHVSKIQHLFLTMKNAWFSILEIMTFRHNCLKILFHCTPENNVNMVFHVRRQ